jgi:hypothetical protein
MTTLFRNGRAVMRTIANPDGSITLSKSVLVKAEHLMRMTGAPGWDKELVDQTFPPGIRGGLRYVNEFVQHDIDIDTFREHAFEKEVEPHGMQYHCKVGHYRTTGLRVVEPKRIELPSKIAFGEVIPCGSCKGRGCPVCEKKGYVPWKRD